MSVTEQAMNRLAIKASIKRASQKARQNVHKLDAQTRQELQRIYSRARLELIDLIQSYAADDGNLKLQVLNGLLTDVQIKLQTLTQRRDQLLGSNLRQASELGAQAFIATNINVTGVTDQAIRFLTSFTAADGLQLSDRLWRLDKHSKQIVTTAIEQAVIQGHSATQAAQAFIKQGEAIPKDLAKKINLAQNGKVSRIIGADLMKKGGPYSNALRLFRTEINRAHGMAYQISAEETEGVVGTQFLLSPHHPETDICDMHAKLNRYGLGKGVYPHGKSPWPAHPNTLSFEVVVFEDEVTKDDKKNKQKPIDWLKQQSPARQQAILGQKKRAALWAGHLKTNQINTPWNALKKRYQAKGIDTDNLKMPPSALLKQSHAINLKSKQPSPKGTKVSSILDPVNHASEVTHVSDMIDNIHGDGVLPLIPIREIRGRNLGYYNPTSVNIGLRGTGDHKELTLAHEIGHFIDHKALPSHKMSSAHSEALKEWRDVTANSPSVKKLINAYTQPNLSPDLKEYFDYLLMPEELWARSYAQYIATKSGSKIMLSQLDKIRYNQQQVLWENGKQWRDDEFKPISKAIDKLFIKQGWIHEPTQ